MTIAAAEVFVPPVPTFRLRVALIVISAIATLVAALHFPISFHEFDRDEPWLLLAQRAHAAQLMLAPFVAGTALALIIMRRARGAIVALAVLMLLGWTSELSETLFNGLKVSATWPGLIAAFERLAVPALGVAAIAFAMRNTRLALATLFVALPMIVTALAIVVFVMSVGIPSS